MNAKKWTPKKKTQPAPWVAMKGGLKPRSATSSGRRQEKTYSRPRIRPISATQQTRLREYLKKRKAWIKGKLCACHGTHAATDVHHMKGRVGPLLLDERFWLPVCRTAHNWIGANVAKAKARGWILPGWNGVGR